MAGPSYTPGPGFGAFVNQLANPPNPMEQLGKTVNALTAVKNYQANQAMADIYSQAIDPVTGQVDQGKLNALIGANPAAAWAAGPAMEQAGHAVGAQGVGTSANVKANLDQLDAIGRLTEPLYKQAIGTNYVNPADAQAQVDQAYQMKLITPQQYQAYSSALKSSDNAASFVIGANTGNEAARTLALGHPGMADVGGGYVPYQPVPGALPSAAPPMTKTLAPGDVANINLQLTKPVEGGWRLPDGTPRNGSVGQWMHDFNIDPGSVYYDPRAGTFSAPGAPTIKTAPGVATPTPEPSGRITPPAAPGTPAPQPPAGAPATPGAPTPTPQPPLGGPTTQGGGRTSMSPQQITAGESAYADAQQAQKGTADRITTANLALQHLDSGALTGGRGTETAQALNAVLGTYGPTEYLTKVITGYDPQKAASDYETTAKYLQQISNSAFPGGASTNDKLSAAVAATPNVHMQDASIRDVLQTVIAGEHMSQYVWTQFGKTGLPPAQYGKWAADWANAHDPRAFLLGHATQQQLEYLQKTMPAGSPARKVFNDTARELRANNVIPDVTQSPDAAPSNE